MEQPIPRMVRFVLILYRFDFRRDKVIDRAGKDNVYFSDERAPSYTKQGNLSLFQPLPPSPPPPPIFLFSSCLRFHPGKSPTAYRVKPSHVHGSGGWGGGGWSWISRPPGSSECREEEIELGRRVEGLGHDPSWCHKTKTRKLDNKRKIICMFWAPG